MNGFMNKIMRRNKRVFAVIMLLLMVITSFYGCGKKDKKKLSGEIKTTASQNVTEENGAGKKSTEENGTEKSKSENGTEDKSAEEKKQEASTGNNSESVISTEDKSTTEESSVTEKSSATKEESLDRNGSYYSKDEVALYIHLYNELPDNFITKKEAKNLGWSGGVLEDYAPGKAIGGDRFGNYEGLLPEKSGRSYTECDIDTKGKKRGAKRIVFSNDGLIYYTDDHYESFTLLYGEEN